MRLYLQAEQRHLTTLVYDIHLSPRYSKTYTLLPPIHIHEEMIVVGALNRGGCG